MPSVWTYTRRDPLWLASMRVRYVGMVRRHADGDYADGDDGRLAEALATLRLRPCDFTADVDALRGGGGTPDRLAGRWPDDEPPIDVRETTEDSPEQLTP